MNQQATSAKNWILDLCIISSLFLIFYTLWLGSYPFFTPDEGRYGEAAREMVATGNYITPHVNGVAFLDKPVLYYWLQAASIHLFGVTEWALRLFPVLFAWLGTLATYITGRVLYDRRTGIISTIVLATTPLYFAGAHYANLDLEVATLIACSLFSILVALEKPERRLVSMLSAYTFAGLAILTKGLIGLIFPIAITGAWIALTRNWKLIPKLHISKGLVIMTAINLPWYILAQQANPNFFHYFFIVQHFSRFLSHGEFNNSMPFWFYLPVALIGCLPWSWYLVRAVYEKAMTGPRGQAAGRRENNTISVERRENNTINVERREGETTSSPSSREHLSAPSSRGLTAGPRATLFVALTQDTKTLFLLLWIAIVILFFSIPSAKIVTYILPIFPAIALVVGNYLNEHWCEDYKQSSMSLACVTAVLLLILVLNAKYLNRQSAKPLARYLNAHAQPTDIVAGYFAFHQDIPLYTGRTLKLVADWKNPDIGNKDNWMRELWFAMPYQDTSKYLINEDSFWKNWRGDKRVYVLLNDNYFDQFKESASYYYIIRKHGDIFLLSNKIGKAG